MDRPTFDQVQFLMEHRHGDRWVPMTPERHGPAEHDPERDWARGRVYRCELCDEWIRVSPEPAREPPR